MSRSWNKKGYFGILALSFKLHLYNCETDPLNNLIKNTVVFVGWLYIVSAGGRRRVNQIRLPSHTQVKYMPMDYKVNRNLVCR